VQRCWWSLARAHSRSGYRIFLAAYLGGSVIFFFNDTATTEIYTDQNDRDYAALQAAAKDGRVQTTTDI
jgi:hypothetical protein